MPPMVSAALRGFGFGLGFSLGFSPVTGAMCHPPISKINAFYAGQPRQNGYIILRLPHLCQIGTKTRQCGAKGKGD